MHEPYEQIHYKEVPKLSYVRTCITLEKSQKDFLENSDYNLSKVCQNRIKELMKLSEGHDMRVAQPSDELQRSSN